MTNEFYDFTRYKNDDIPQLIKSIKHKFTTYDDDISYRIYFRVESRKFIVDKIYSKFKVKPFCQCCFFTCYSCSGKYDFSKNMLEHYLNLDEEKTS